jgi:glycogen operon protein
MAAGAIRAGSSAPLGASIADGGVNFSVYSRHATRIDLLLFDGASASKPARIIPLDSRRHRTYHYWHAFVPDLRAGQLYAYRADGPFEPERGLRFDAEKVLLDPYGQGVAVPERYDRNAARAPGDNTPTAMKSVVVGTATYDWEGDRHIRRPFVETVIYEMHVRGFTRHPSSGVARERRGTYAGLIDKIPYLTDLGVTALELLPVFQFDRFDAPGGRTNYWGYQPVSFFAPHAAYSSCGTPLGAVDEFRDLVKACHRAGLEVILDVVFNHTSEGGSDGPTLCWRGFANEVYYTLDNDKSRYADFSGCGNTLNANQPVVRRMIQDSLRYWVTEMHVDGFRFDLASVLSRDESGHPLPNAPVLWDIESDPVLAGTKLIAEAWDAAGLYQVGRFVGDTWQEWNGLFRDDVRGFLKAEHGLVSRVASRLLGSPDLYEHKGREAEQSVNFVTCHDGFTLNDLVSYNEKHNDANGEDNRDGANDNRSWNCGVEGPTDDPSVEALRNRQVKNFLALLLIAAGTPMLLMGDEMRRTQLGNNNAYCHDDEANWLDWTGLERHADIHRFVKALLAFRQTRDVVLDGDGASLSDILTLAAIEWHGVDLHTPDWDPHSHTLAFTASSVRGRFLWHVIINAFWEPLTFRIPAVPPGTDGAWRCCLDTARPCPADVVAWSDAVPVTALEYEAGARSVVMLALAIQPGWTARSGDAVEDARERP